MMLHQEEPEHDRDLNGCQTPSPREAYTRSLLGRRQQLPFKWSGEGVCLSPRKLQRPGLSADCPADSVAPASPSARATPPQPFVLLPTPVEFARPSSPQLPLCAGLQAPSLLQPLAVALRPQLASPSPSFAAQPAGDPLAAPTATPHTGFEPRQAREFSFSRLQDLTPAAAELEASGSGVHFASPAGGESGDSQGGLVRQARPSQEPSLFRQPTSCPRQGVVGLSALRVDQQEARVVHGLPLQDELLQCRLFRLLQKPDVDVQQLRQLQSLLLRRQLLHSAARVGRPFPRAENLHSPQSVSEREVVYQQQQQQQQQQLSAEIPQPLQVPGTGECFDFSFAAALPNAPLPSLGAVPRGHGSRVGRQSLDETISETPARCTPPPSTLRSRGGPRRNPPLRISRNSRPDKAACQTLEQSKSQRPPHSALPFRRCDVPAPKTPTSSDSSSLTHPQQPHLQQQQPHPPQQQPLHQTPPPAVASVAPDRSAFRFGGGCCQTSPFSAGKGNLEVSRGAPLMMGGRVSAGKTSSSLKTNFFGAASPSVKGVAASQQQSPGVPVKRVSRRGGGAGVSPAIASSFAGRTLERPLQPTPAKGAGSPSCTSRPLLRGGAAETGGLATSPVATGLASEDRQSTLTRRRRSRGKASPGKTPGRSLPERAAVAPSVVDSSAKASAASAFESSVKGQEEEAADADALRRTPRVETEQLQPFCCCSDGSACDFSSGPWVELLPRRKSDCGAGTGSSPSSTTTEEYDPLAEGPQKRWLELQQLLLLQHLGSGAMGHVFLVEFGGRLFALKLALLDDAAASLYLRQGWANLVKLEALYRRKQRARRRAAASESSQSTRCSVCTALSGGEDSAAASSGAAESCDCDCSCQDQEEEASTQQQLREGERARRGEALLSSRGSGKGCRCCQCQCSGLPPTSQRRREERRFFCQPLCYLEGVWLHTSKGASLLGPQQQPLQRSRVCAYIAEFIPSASQLTVLIWHFHRSVDPQGFLRKQQPQPQKQQQRPQQQRGSGGESADKRAAALAASRLLQLAKDVVAAFEYVTVEARLFAFDFNPKNILVSVSVPGEELYPLLRQPSGPARGDGEEASSDEASELGRRSAARTQRVSAQHRRQLHHLQCLQRLAPLHQRSRGRSGLEMTQQAFLNPKASVRVVAIDLDCSLSAPFSAQAADPLLLEWGCGRRVVYSCPHVPSLVAAYILAVIAKNKSPGQFQRSGLTHTAAEDALRARMRSPANFLHFLKGAGDSRDAALFQELLARQQRVDGFSMESGGGGGDREEPEEAVALRRQRAAASEGRLQGATAATASMSSTKSSTMSSTMSVGREALLPALQLCADAKAGGSRRCCCSCASPSCTATATTTPSSSNFASASSSPGKERLCGAAEEGSRRTAAETASCASASRSVCPSRLAVLASCAVPLNQPLFVFPVTMPARRVPSQQHHDYGIRLLSGHSPLQLLAFVLCDLLDARSLHNVVLQQQKQLLQLLQLPTDVTEIFSEQSQVLSCLCFSALTRLQTTVPVASSAATDLLSSFSKQEASGQPSAPMAFARGGEFSEASASRVQTAAAAANSLSKNLASSKAPAAAAASHRVGACKRRLAPPGPSGLVGGEEDGGGGVGGSDGSGARGRAGLLLAAAASAAAQAAASAGGMGNLSVWQRLELLPPLHPQQFLPPDDCFGDAAAKATQRLNALLLLIVDPLPHHVQRMGGGSRVYEHLTAALEAVEKALCVTP